MMAKPSSGLMPSRNDAAPPALLTSASAWPANDCPRTTVKTPMTAETTAAVPPTAAAVRTGPLDSQPGSKTSDARCTSALMEPS